MSKHNKKNSSRSPDDERFWRRFTSLFREDELWTKDWNLDEIVDFILEHEKRPPSREDDKSYRKRLTEEIAKIVSSSRSNATHFTWQGNNLIRPRMREEIIEINEASNCKSIDIDHAIYETSKLGR